MSLDFLAYLFIAFELLVNNIVVKCTIYNERVGVYLHDRDKQRYKFFFVISDILIFKHNKFIPSKFFC